MTVNWVGQEEPDGCGVAVVAMLAGCSYQEVRQEVPGDLPAHLFALTRFLERRGFEVERRYWDFDALLSDPARDCPLWISIGNNEWRHAMLLLPDGTVMDPDTPERRALSSYAPVCAAAKVRRVEP